MPLYEYVCRECGHEFEALVLGGKLPECPRCGSRELEQALSTFAMRHGASRAQSTSASPGSCAPSGG